ncbi:hypothetical protein AAFC00_004325 [Neodothiora populina]|uniref:ASST-domain-containing protein n=1 Tax=Neodothiora populina TaxID=2781224 RepID=A0ABR3PJD2_9PEZI
MDRLFRLLLLGFFSASCVVRAHDVGDDFDTQDGEAYELNYGYYPYRSYQTTDLVSPVLRKVIDSPQCHDDLYTFITPRGYSISAPGPAIVDNNGDLIWARTTDGQAYDLVVHDVDGKQYLTYWIGDDRIRGHGQGDYYMLNSSYQQVAKISAIGDLKADLHELTLTPEGTALITIYSVNRWDLFGFRDFDQDLQLKYIWDCLFQEIDLETNELLFEWRASDHCAINDTFREIQMDGEEDSPWDWFHINSIQKDELGNYLISARYTHSITYINGTSGDIIWVLGGKRNGFEDLSDGAATNFAWQHDARMMPLSTFPKLMKNEIRDLGLGEGETDHDGVTTQLLSLFNNAAEDRDSTDSLSHGMLLEISYPSAAPIDNVTGDHSGDLTKREDSVPANQRYTVRLVQSYDHPQGVLSSSQGSLQVVPKAEAGQDPKVLLGYGFNAVITEYQSTGEPICDTHFATNYSWGRGDVQSYRAYKFPWVGHPREPPTAVLSDDAMYVSWNGATEVRAWVLQHSSQFMIQDSDAWTDLVQVNKKGFETRIDFDEDDAMRYLRVAALDSDGRVLGYSRDVDLGWTAGITSAIPKLADTGFAPLKLLMLFTLTITALFLIYEGYKYRNQGRRQEHRSVRLHSEV